MSFSDFPLLKIPFSLFKLPIPLYLPSCWAYDFTSNFIKRSKHHWCELTYLPIPFPKSQPASSPISSAKMETLPVHLPKANPRFVFWVSSALIHSRSPTLWFPPFYMLHKSLLYWVIPITTGTYSSISHLLDPFHAPPPIALFLCPCLSKTSLK